MHWENYVSGTVQRGFFDTDLISFNSHQERLHRLAPGDRLWLVSRNPEDGQYYFIAALTIAKLCHNSPESEKGRAFGEYAVECDRVQSLDLRQTFPAEGLLRAFVFETNRPVKYGANIGQSLQTLRILAESDEKVLNSALTRVLTRSPTCEESACGLWTKCDKVFADYFLHNWTSRHEPLAFLLYDPPPVVQSGMPVFIHSDKGLRLIARFISREYIAGHKQTVENDERLIERERIWSRYRLNTLNPPEKLEFDKFWQAQNGIRALFLMDHVIALPKPVAFKVYGNALEWGYPMGVGYRYLGFAQSVLLLRIAKLPDDLNELYLSGILGRKSEIYES